MGSGLKLKVTTLVTFNFRPDPILKVAIFVREETKLALIRRLLDSVA